MAFCAANDNGGGAPEGRHHLPKSVSATFSYQNDDGTLYDWSHWETDPLSRDVRFILDAMPVDMLPEAASGESPVGDNSIFEIERRLDRHVLDPRNRAFMDYAHGVGLGCDTDAHGLWDFKLGERVSDYAAYLEARRSAEGDALQDESLYRRAVELVDAGKSALEELQRAREAVLRYRLLKSSFASALAKRRCGEDTAGTSRKDPVGEPSPCPDEGARRLLDPLDGAISECRDDLFGLFSTDADWD